MEIEPAKDVTTERLLTVGDVCNVMQVAATFVYRHAAELGAIKVGSHLRFRLGDIQSWLETQRMSDSGQCRTPVDNEVQGQSGPRRRRN